MSAPTIDRSHERPKWVPVIVVETERGSRLRPEADAAGSNRVFAHLFDSQPDVEFIADSSNIEHWIRMKNDILRQQGIDVCNLLIWKTPLEFAQSRNKRNSLPGWQTEWRNALRVCFTLIDHWRAVRYQCLATDPDTVLPAFSTARPGFLSASAMSITVGPHLDPSAKPGSRAVTDIWLRLKSLHFEDFT